MSTINAIISEIEQEAHNSKKILARVPSEKFDWKPHEKSMSLKNLATHVAHLSEWPALVVNTGQLDFSNNDLEKPVVHTTADLIRILEKGTKNSVDALKAAKEEGLEEKWVLRNGEIILLEMPRIAVIRGISMNHLIHHRGQLSVYLRLLGVPVPGMYGPSADEKN